MNNEADPNPAAFPVSGLQRREILRRSAAYSLNSGAAVPLVDALERIERSLMGFPK